MNLQQTYYLPITANRPDIASTLTDYVEYLQRTGNLNTNVPTQWQHDSAAAPTGAPHLADLSHRLPCTTTVGLSSSECLSLTD